MRVVEVEVLAADDEDGARSECAADDVEVEGESGGDTIGKDDLVKKGGE